MQRQIIFLQATITGFCIARNLESDRLPGRTGKAASDKTKYFPIFEASGYVQAETKSDT